MNCKHGLESLWCSLCRPTSEQRQSQGSAGRRGIDSRLTRTSQGMKGQGSHQSIMDLKTGPELHVQVQMAKPNHISKRSGRPGYFERRQFPWRGQDWTLRFQAAPQDSQPDTTHGMIEEGAAGTAACAVTGGAFPHLLEGLMESAERERRYTGWRIEKLSSGVRGSFDPSRLRTLPKGKTGGYASFCARFDGQLYLAQFLLQEQPQPGTRPIDRDWSRGAKAGLPTLGKRR